MVSIAIAGAVSIIVAMRFPILVDGLVLRAVMGTVLFVFVSFFVIRAIVSFGGNAMRFPILMDGLVLRAVMGAVLFVFMIFFVISAIICLTVARIVMSVTISVSKRDRSSDTEH